MKTRGRMKRLGGRLSKRFGIFHGELQIGEVRHENDSGWCAYLPVPGGEWFRLPGSYETKEDAREAVADANQPGETT